MKTRLYAISGLAIVACLGIGALAEEDGEPRGRGRGGPIQRFDKDGDGMLNAEEVAAAKEAGAKFIDKADANGDGTIDQAEIEQLRARFRNRQGKGDGLGDGPGIEDDGRRERFRRRLLERFDANKDGTLDEEERAAVKAARDELLKDYDADGDGKLSPEERKAMIRDRRPKDGRGRGRNAAPARPEDAPVIIQ